MTPDAYVAALKRERAAYLAAGRDDRAAEVAAELARAGETDPVANAPAEATPRRRSRREVDAPVEVPEADAEDADG